MDELNRELAEFHAKYVEVEDEIATLNADTLELQGKLVPVPAVEIEVLLKTELEQTAALFGHAMFQADTTVAGKKAELDSACKSLQAGLADIPSLRKFMESHINSTSAAAAAET